jgi:hypothetical protein
MTLIVQETQLERPIRGVVHAAMVLRVLHNSLISAQPYLN